MGVLVRPILVLLHAVSSVKHSSIVVTVGFL